MLLTRSPLYARPKASYSFDLHVLGAPPAFILSQDQTLRGKSSPERLSILVKKLNQGPYGCFGGYSPEALSGFVKFHPQYPVLKVPGGACGPPCASRSRLAQD